MKKLKFASLFCAFLYAQAVFGDLNVNTSMNTTSGDSVTAWENYVGPGNNIFVATQSGGVWVPSVGVANPATFPMLAQTGINTSGQSVVIWLATDPISSNQAVYGSIFNGTSWVTTQVSDGANEYVLGNHQVKIANDGRIVITWAAFVFTTFTNEARAFNVPPPYGTSFTGITPVSIP